MGNNQDMLDFSNVEAAEGGNGLYLKPGIYYVKPSAVELSEKEGKTPMLKITFTAVVGNEYEGQTVDERFFLSPKALPRLQYLHEKYLGFKLENKAISLKQLEEYFQKKLLTKPKTLVIKVEGEENAGKVYGRLPYADFILDDDNVDEGAFEEGSDEYRRAVKKSRNASTNSSAAVLSMPQSAATDDLPWERNK